MIAPTGPAALTVLVIDDDPDVLRTVERHLVARGHLVHAVGSGAEGLAILRREPIDIAITDLVMPGMSGFEVLREARRASPATDLIVITAHADVEGAVRVMREGVLDFLRKPLRLEELQASILRTVRYRDLRREKDRWRQRVERLGAEAGRHQGIGGIVGDSRAIRQVKEAIAQVAGTDATTVLVLGETGTGKELVARAIHAESARSAGPFEAVDCFTSSLADSELFGHARGAYTDAREARRGIFELADGGTLFLDEAANLDLPVQAKLLRALEERRIRRLGAERSVSVDVRVISASNQDLGQAVARGAFREDLYYRLNVFTIRTPPLRERKEDVVPLARHFLERYAREMGKPMRGLDPGAEGLLLSHAFPGNVRELRNWIERAVIVARGPCVSADDLGERREAIGRAFDPARFECLDLAAIERAVVDEALRRAGENQTQAARLLNVTRRQLYTMLKNQGR